MQTTLKTMKSRCGHVRWVEAAVTALDGSGRARSGIGAEAQLAADHEALHLARALPDLEDLGVAVEPRDGRLVDEAVAPEDLRGLAGRGDRALGRVELRHGRVLLERPAGVL